MKRQWILRVLTCFVLLILCGAIVLFVNMMQGSKLTEENTKAYTAVVSHVEVTISGQNRHVWITTKDNKTDLVLLSVNGELVSQEDLDALYAGQNIVFRLERDQEQVWGQANHINIVSLRAGDRDILTLEEYEIAIADTKQTLKSFSFGVILVLAVSLAWLVCRIRRPEKSKG